MGLDSFLRDKPSDPAPDHAACSFHPLLFASPLPCFEMRKLTLLLALASFLALLLVISQFPVFAAYRSTACLLKSSELTNAENNFATTRATTSVSSVGSSVAVFDARAASSNLNESGLGEKRRFFPVGTGAYLFIEMGAYRGGPRDFSVVGLGSKPVHVFAKASFRCEWISSTNTRTVGGKVAKMLPDWGYGRVYTVVVVGCSFQEDVGTDSEGGDLILYASPGTSFAKNSERMVVLREYPGDYNDTVFNPPYPFECAYCGSPLFGDISPQRVREWVAYHIKFFGPHSHFFLYDAGGIHPGVQMILEPWIKAGRITIQDVRDQEQFDGYYHNQFLIVNDCLHRTRFLANWTFFFDVDEFLYMPENSSLQSLLAEHSRFTQILIEQRPMSSQLCLNDTQTLPQTNRSEQWGFEKLVFNSLKRGVGRDRKYAIQPRNVYATGVHLTENMRGRSKQVRGEKLRYYHYHGTISFRGEVCREVVQRPNNTDTVVFQKEPFRPDYSMQPLAASARQFELEQLREELPFLL